MELITTELEIFAKESNLSNQILHQFKKSEFRIENSALKNPKKEPLEFQCWPRAMG